MYLVIAKPSNQHAYRWTPPRECGAAAARGANRLQGIRYFVCVVLIRNEKFSIYHFKKLFIVGARKTAHFREGLRSILYPLL